MAAFLSHLLSFPLLAFSSSSSSSLFLVSSFRPPSARPQITASSSAAASAFSLMDNKPKKFMDFPYVSTPHKKLMIDLESSVENRLDSQLQPCILPPDVQYYHNQSRTSQGSLHIRSGNSSSQALLINPFPVDFILGNWLHCEVPTGGAMNITTLQAYLKASTDAPNFVMDIIQSSPTSLVLLLDLIPRKDLVFHPEYFQTFYVDTKLDSLRLRLIDKLPEVRPYSPTLRTRCITSPTSIVIQIDTEGAGSERMEEIVKDHVDPVAKQVLAIWLDQCAYGGRNVLEEAEKQCLAKRDRLIKNMDMEYLSSSYSSLFGADVGNRIISVIRNAYNV
ncbi:hypothetical protein REPUB_Repub09cG0164600 [Reevesia pubescens]